MSRRGGEICCLGRYNDPHCPDNTRHTRSVYSWSTLPKNQLPHQRIVNIGQIREGQTNAASLTIDQPKQWVCLHWMVGLVRGRLGNSHCRSWWLCTNLGRQIETGSRNIPTTKHLRGKAFRLAEMLWAHYHESKLASLWNQMKWLGMPDLLYWQQAERN